MLQYNPSITGSLKITGSLLVTGDITALGGITISGSVASASYALSASEASMLQGLGSASFAPAVTFNTVSQSFATTSGSLSTRVTSLESASSSFAAQSASLSTRLTTDESNYTSLSSSFATTSGSAASRLNVIETSYATTGSNNFTKPQQISDVSNAISFTSTASLYTSGGARIAKDLYVSGGAYFNNITVYGTSSIQYITSSQLDISDNIIAVNTFTPAVRFGGLAVYDSGSTSLTGSMLWDSENNRWIYSNPSGSTYDGGMIISGPRNTTGLGNEVGTTSCALMMGQGGDHITSSAIFSYGNATCFYGQSYISSSGNAYFAGNVGIGTTNPSTSLGAATVRGLVVNGGSSADVQFRLQNTNTGCTDNDGGLFSLAGDNSIYLWNYENAGLHLGTNNTDRLFITAGGCVGIGTTNPTYQLQVTSAAPSILLEATGSTGAAYLRFNNTTRSSTNYIALGGTTNDLFFTVNGADRFFISGSGNVGIGTTQPNRSLSIQRSSESWIESITTQTTTQCWLFGQDGVRKGFEVYDLNQSATRLFVAPTTGYVGISNVCPNSPLSFSNGTGDKIDFFNNGSARYTAQINSSELRLYTSVAADFISLYAGNVAGLVNRNGKIVISGTCTDAVFSVGDWCNRGGRLLTSNCLGWYADGVTPCSIIVTNNAATCKGTSIGLVLHNDNQTTSNWTPSLVFSRRSYSGIYNSAIASIQAQTLGCGNDANWNGGDLVFSVNPVGGYMGENLRLSANYACFSGTVCALSGIRLASGATTLNYFEEGIWQPVLKDSNNNTVASDNFSNAGRYTRIGNRVFFALYSRFNLSGIGAGDGGFTANLRISLPFSACSTSPSGTGENFVPINISYWSSFYCLNSGDFPSGYVRSGESNFQLTFQNVACFGEFTFGTSRLTRSSSAGIMVAGHYYAS